jgi:hypothetical protein
VNNQIFSIKIITIFSVSKLLKTPTEIQASAVPLAEIWPVAGIGQT